MAPATLDINVLNHQLTAVTRWTHNSLMNIAGCGVALLLVGAWKRFLYLSGLNVDTVRHWDKRATWPPWTPAVTFAWPFTDYQVFSVAASDAAGDAAGDAAALRCCPVSAQSQLQTSALLVSERNFHYCSVFPLSSSRRLQLTQPAEGFKIK